jgi:hypothetical protein
MRIYIRNVSTGLYLNSNEWVAEVSKARDFERGSDAIKFIVEQGLSNVEVVHAFPDSQYNFSSGRIGPTETLGKTLPFVITALLVAC